MFSVHPSDLHLPLLKALMDFRQLTLLPGQVVFHGCHEASQYIDVSGMRLHGTRKWVSADASYSSDYTLPATVQEATGLIWVCKIKHPIPALFGSQHKLIEADVAPWELSESHYIFPNHFAGYARHLLSTDGPVALVNSRDDACTMREILICEPQDALEVIEIVQLPTKSSAHSDNSLERRQIGLHLNAKYFPDLLAPN